MMTWMKTAANKLLNIFGLHLLKKSTFTRLMENPSYSEHANHLIYLNHRYQQFADTEKNISQDFQINNPLQAKDREDILTCLSKIKLNSEKNSLFFLRNSSSTFLQKSIKEYAPMLEHNLLFSENSVVKGSRFNNVCIFEPNIAALFFLRPHYLEALRNICKDEILIFFYLSSEGESVADAYHVIHADPLIEENNKIYLTQAYVRQQLHAAGFLETHGIYTPFYGDFLNTSRKIEVNGLHRFINEPNALPKYKGIAAIRAHRRCFRDNSL